MVDKVQRRSRIVTRFQVVQDNLATRLVERSIEVITPGNLKVTWNRFFCPLEIISTRLTRCSSCLLERHQEAEGGILKVSVV